MLYLLACKLIIKILYHIYYSLTKLDSTLGLWCCVHYHINISVPKTIMNFIPEDDKQFMKR